MWTREVKPSACSLWPAPREMLFCWACFERDDEKDAALAEPAPPRAASLERWAFTTRRFAPDAPKGIARRRRAEAPTSEYDLAATICAGTSSSSFHSVPFLCRHIFKKMMLKGRFNISLDYETEVFLSLFSSTPHKNLAWEHHALRSLVSNVTPPIVHFNGGIAEANLSWMGGFQARDLLRYDCPHLRPRGANRQCGVTRQGSFGREVALGSRHALMRGKAHISVECLGMSRKCGTRSASSQ